MSLTDFAAVPSRSDSKKPDDDVVFSSGSIRVQLDESDLDRIRELASDRNHSYQTGETLDDNFSKDKSGRELHLQGLFAEAAMEKVYGVNLDESVSASGDGGIDGELPSDLVDENDSLTFDIKSRDADYPNSALLVKKPNVQKRQEHPDIYVSSYVDMENNYVKIDGWLYFDELADEENVAEARGDWLDHMNYDVEVSETRDMWKPATDN